jgi:hypothetical protein
MHRAPTLIKDWGAGPSCRSRTWACGASATWITAASKRNTRLLRERRTVGCVGADTCVTARTRRGRMRRDRCPVCETLAETGRPVGRDAFQVRCPRCGPFILTGTAAAMLPSRLDADPRAVARTSHAIRSRTSEEDWLEIDSTRVDDLTTHPLPAPPRQLANLINWLRQQAGDGGLAPIDVTDRNALAAIAGASDADALEHLLRWAVKEDLVELSSDGKNATLTPGAWESGKKEAAATIGTRRTELKVETVKGHCPRCGPDRRADVVASHEESWDTEDGLI